MGDICNFDCTLNGSGPSDELQKCGGAVSAAAEDNARKSTNVRVAAARGARGRSAAASDARSCRRIVSRAMQPQRRLSQSQVSSLVAVAAHHHAKYVGCKRARSDKTDLSAVTFDPDRYVKLLGRIMNESEKLQNNPPQGLVPQENLCSDHVLEALAVHWRGRSADGRAARIPCWPRQCFNQVCRHDLRVDRHRRQPHGCRARQPRGVGALPIQAER